jgi:uncharacterized protein (DUF433 family)
MAIATMDYIDVDEKGVARIAGSRIKVRFIAVERVHKKRTPEEIQADFPHLTLAQIYAALAYYYDHKAQIDEEIGRADRLYEELKAQAPPSPVAQRLRSQGLLP